MIVVLYLLAAMGAAMLAVGCVAWWLAAMTYPGWGGQQAPPQNASPAAQLVPGVQPGTTGQIIATRVIIIGSNGDLLVYSSTPAAGNLIESISGAAGTDHFGNNFVAGTASYAATFAAALAAGFVQFYTGSLAGGWTVSGTIETDAFGDIILLAAAGRQVTTNNNTLDNGSGNAVIVGTLSVNGSGSTASAGLPDGTIHGTSGPASAGTAHTHSPGSFAVGNGVHSHVL